ncbi:MAG: LysR substrate-binding domain-containing protein [Vibrio casei]
MNDRLPLKSIYAFITVAETGSMVEAAAKLNVSHSAISQAIKSLESQLNLPLFNRIGRRVELNAPGSHYYRRVSPAITEIIQATQEIQAKESALNYLTVNMVNSMALHWWIPRVSEFQTIAPEIDVRISNLATEFNFERDGIDVAIIHGKPLQTTHSHCEKLGDDELILVCSPILHERLLKELKNKKTITPEQLLYTYPAIFVNNPRRQNDWQLWCDAYNFTLPNQHKNLTFSISIQATQAAIRHLGIFVTHKQYVRDDIKHGMLVPIGDAVKNPHQQFYFATPKANLKNKQVLALRDWLKTEFCKS